MMLLYVLIRTDRWDDDHEIAGIYSTMELAKDAERRLSVNHFDSKYYIREYFLNAEAHE